MNNGATKGIETNEKMITIENGFYVSKEKGCISDTRKITHYLLKPGSKHYQEFHDVGYSENDPDRLFEDIVCEYDLNRRSDESVTAVGTLSFSIMMELGITRKRTFRTVWELPGSGETAKLITAYSDRRVN